MTRATSIIGTGASSTVAAVTDTAAEGRSYLLSKPKNIDITRPKIRYPNRP